MEWTNKLTFAFLNLYQNEPSLWNSNAAEHKNKNDSYGAWSRIKTQLRDGNIPIKELKRKRDNLMSTYRRLRTRVKDSQTTGKGAEDVYKPDWPFYLHMSMFLDDQYIPKKTKYSEDIELPEEQGSGREDDDGEKGQKDSSSKSPKKVPKRRKTDQVGEAEKRIDEVYNYFKMMAQNSQRDECSLYTDLLCKKLRTLKESTREKAMLEIDRYVYNLRQQDLLQQPSSQCSSGSNPSTGCQHAHFPQSSPNPPFILQPKLSPYSEHSCESDPSAAYQTAYSPQSSPNPQFISHLKSSPYSQHSSESNPSLGYQFVCSLESSLNSQYSSQAQLIPQTQPTCPRHLAPRPLYSPQTQSNYPPQSSPDENPSQIIQTKIKEENSGL